jgi:hypothetical protein
MNALIPINTPRVQTDFEFVSCRIQRIVPQVANQPEALEHVTSVFKFKFRLQTRYIHYLRPLCMRHVVPCVCNLPWASRFRRETFTATVVIPVDFTSIIESGPPLDPRSED